MRFLRFTNIFAATCTKNKSFRYLLSKSLLVPTKQCNSRLTHICVHAPPNFYKQKLKNVSKNVKEDKKKNACEICKRITCIRVVFDSRIVRIVVSVLETGRRQADKVAHIRRPCPTMTEAVCVNL